MSLWVIGQVLAAPKGPARCIGYRTKYLTEHAGDCHETDTDAQADHVTRLAEVVRYEPYSSACVNGLRCGIQPATWVP